MDERDIRAYCRCTCMQTKFQNKKDRDHCPRPGKRLIKVQIFNIVCSQTRGVGSNLEVVHRTATANQNAAGPGNPGLWAL